MSLQLCGYNTVYCTVLGWACSGGDPSTPSPSGASCGECLGERTETCKRGKHFSCLFCGAFPYTCQPKLPLFDLVLEPRDTDLHLHHNKATCLKIWSMLRFLMFRSSVTKSSCKQVDKQVHSLCYIFFWENSWKVSPLHHAACCLHLLISRFTVVSATFTSNIGKPQLKTDFWFLFTTKAPATCFKNTFLKQ